MTTHDYTKLKETLAELHTELSRLDPADGEARALLIGTLDEIQAALQSRQSGEAAPTTESGITGRLATAARDFEDTHPQLSGLLGSVIDALSRMGI